MAVKLKKDGSKLPLHNKSTIAGLINWGIRVARNMQSPLTGYQDSTVRRLAALEYPEYVQQYITYKLTRINTLQGFVAADKKEQEATLRELQAYLVAYNDQHPKSGRSSSDASR